MRKSSLITLVAALALIVAWSIFLDAEQNQPPGWQPPTPVFKQNHVEVRP